MRTSSLPLLLLTTVTLAAAGCNGAAPPTATTSLSGAAPGPRLAVSGITSASPLGNAPRHVLSGFAAAAGAPGLAVPGSSLHPARSVHAQPVTAPAPASLPVHGLPAAPPSLPVHGGLPPAPASLPVHGLSAATLPTSLLSLHGSPVTPTPGSVSPLPGGPVTAPAPCPAPRASGRTYVVRTGDTLSDIARAFGVSLRDLVLLNSQIRDVNLIYPGDLVYLPAGASGAPHFEVGVGAHGSSSGAGRVDVSPVGANGTTLDFANAAIGWATSDPINPNTGNDDWYYPFGWCLALVGNAYTHAGHSDPELTTADCARHAYDNFVAAGAVVHDVHREAPPRGAVIFWNWVASDGKNYGHVAIANGDGTCTTICAYGQGDSAYGRTIASHMAISAFHLELLGWVNPITRQ